MAEGSILRSFPRTFWVANTMELFERAAYYGLNSVLAVYLSGKVHEGGLGFDEQSVGFLQGLVYAATYVIPIVGGALADRYGYRRMLMLAFSLLSTGYFLAGLSKTYALVFLFMLVMATGAGLFKPIISGTIARTTDAKSSALGFGIYYWMINLGALAAPLVVSYLKGFSWSYVFFASAIYTGAMLLPALLFYRDPPRPANTRTLREALLGAAEVLGDARFMLMVVVYSGFWVLYFQNFSTVLWYLEDFIDATPINAAVNAVLGALGIGAKFTFDAEHVTVINALTIILLQFFVSRIVEKRSPLPTMMTGMAMGAVGFALLASSQNAWIFVAGIAVFSIGEMTAHPKYYSFIGLVAPADRKAVYMGYAFLYGVFGSLIGSNIGALAYKNFLKPVAHTPEAGGRAAIMWGSFAALDLLAAIALFFFSKKFGEDNAESRSKARLAMMGIYGLLAALGVGFLGWAVSGDTVQYKTAVQAVLFLLLGAGGLAVSMRAKPSAAPAS
ncbi:MAG TPA: MFS transporter [Myxococcales bacterium]|jgi:dipeptide/tripeptide permease